jgi:tetratricopeptide (TPR) repeat protein
VADDARRATHVVELPDGRIYDATIRGRGGVPNSALLLNNRGMHFHSMGRDREALTDLNAALKKDPQFLPALINRGFVHMQAGRGEEAEKDLTAAIEMSPGSTQAYTMRGNARVSQGRAADAIADYRKVTEMTPASGIAAADLGFAFFFTGDYAAFVLGARKAAPVFEDDARVKREGIAEVRDMVWHAVSMSAGRITESEADLLADYLRPDLLGRDTSDATRAAELVKGMGAGRAVRDRSFNIERRNDPHPLPAPQLPPTPPAKSPTPASAPPKP